MPLYYDCAEDELPEYQCDTCGGREKGRVRSSGVINKAYLPTLLANPSSTLLWTTGIDSGDIVIFSEVIGSLDVPDPIVGPGYGDNVEEVLGTDFTLNIRDPNYITNCTFFNTLKRQRNKWHALYRTSSQTHISDKTVTINTKAPITENLEDNVEWQVSMKWRSLDNPCPFDTPEDVFDCFSIIP